MSELSNVKKDDIFVAEFSLNKLTSKNVKPIKHKEPSKYPEINKDLAFVVKKEVTVGELMTQIKKSGSRLLTDIDVFDVYVGENVKEDEKSIAFSLTFADPTRTLNDEKELPSPAEIKEVLDTYVNVVKNYKNQI